MSFLSTVYHRDRYVALPGLFPAEVLLAFYRMMQADLQAAGIGAVYCEAAGVVFSALPHHVFGGCGLAYGTEIAGFVDATCVLLGGV